MSRWSLALLLLSGASLVGAQPVIPPGQETRVLELLEPHGFGAPPVDGWSVAGVQIERRHIDVVVDGPGERRATLRLHHPDAVDTRERSASFGLERRPANARGLDPWVRAVRANDDGEFWGAMPTVHERRTSPSASAEVLRDLGLFALALVLIAAVAWALRRWGPALFRRALAWEAPAPLPALAPLDRDGWLTALAVTVATAAILFFAAPVPPLHADTVRDLLLARDCLSSGLCLGASTSFADLEQHVGWVRLLAALRALGLGSLAAHHVVIIADALATGLVFVLAARLLRRPTAVLCAALYLSAMVWAAELPILWNPSLAPLAYAVLFFGLLGVARAEISGAIAGVGVALAVETHIAGLIALGVAVFALRALASKPGRAVAVAMVVFVSLELALSWSAIVSNLQAAPRRWVLAAIALGLVIAWLVGRAVRRRLDAKASTRWVVLALSALGTTLPALIGVLVAGHFLQARYFLPALLPLALLGGLGLEWLLTAPGVVRRGVAAALAVGLVVAATPVWREAAEAHALSMDDTRRIQRALDERGLPYGELRLRLRGPEVSTLGAALALWATDSSFRPTHDTPDLRVVRAIEAPDGWREVPLRRGPSAWIGPLESWLDLDRAEVCLVAEEAPTCHRLGPRDWRDFGGARTAYERLRGDRIPVLEAMRERLDGEQEAFARIPLRLSGPDARRTLQLFDERDDAEHWRIARIEGVAYAGELGGQRITLTREGALHGTLTLAHGEPVGSFVPSLPVQLLEMRPAELPLLDTVCAAHPGCAP